MAHETKCKQLTSVNNDALSSKGVKCAKLLQTEPSVSNWQLKSQIYGGESQQTPSETSI